MRARNIKPATFQNELLGCSDPLYTVIFAGLWCLADRDGRLEDRPGKIHMQINAGRELQSTTRSLDWLTEYAFIQRYEVDGQSYIFILEFGKHQHPHVREPESVIPKPPKYVKPKKLNGAAQPDPVQAPNKPGAEHRPFALIPDSGSLDSGSLDTPLPSSLRSRVTSAPKRAAGEIPDWLDVFKLHMPKRAGAHDWRGAVKAGNARLAEGHTIDQFVEGADRYARYVEAVGKQNTEFVKMAATFLGPSKFFLELWECPQTKGETRRDKTIAASQEWLAQRQRERGHG